MSTLVERGEALAVDVFCASHTLRVVLADARTISVPLAWSPRLLEATPKQRAEWKLIGGGIGIHWETIDEDISVASLLQPENFMHVPTKRMQPPREKRRAQSGAETHAADAQGVRPTRVRSALHRRGDSTRITGTA